MRKYIAITGQCVKSHSNAIIQAEWRCSYGAQTDIPTNVCFDVSKRYNWEKALVLELRNSSLLKSRSKTTYKHGMYSSTKKEVSV